MRMRRKKNLEARLERCSSLLIARENYDFYKKDEEARLCVADLKQIFPEGEIYIEIGCGKGGFAVKSAKLNPEKNYVAVEKISNVIVEACEKALCENLPNLRFLNCGAENLLCFLPPCSADGIYLNFSCPYPKNSYENRRLTYKSYLGVYRRLLKPGRKIYQKTDDKDFFIFSLSSFIQNGFEVSDVTYDLHGENLPTVTTEYESKFIAEGKPIMSLTAFPLEKYE